MNKYKLKLLNEKKKSRIYLSFLQIRKHQSINKQSQPVYVRAESIIKIRQIKVIYGTKLKSPNIIIDKNQTTEI